MCLTEKPRTPRESRGFLGRYLFMHWETVSRGRPTKHGFKSATNRQIRLAERAHYRPSFFPKKEERTYSSASRRVSNKASAVHLLLYVAEKRRSTARQARPAPLPDWI